MSDESAYTPALLSELGSVWRQVRQSGSEQQFRQMVARPDSRQQLLTTIATQVAQWWEQDPEQIPRVLYRIDVDERIAREAFGSADPIGELAEAILQRLTLTAQTRLHYRRYQADQANDSQLSDL